MALYLGSEKVKISIDGIAYCLNLLHQNPNRLFSSDGYALRSSDGLWLTVLDTVVNNCQLVSSDDYILKDSNGLYLVYKESE